MFHWKCLAYRGSTGLHTAYFVRPMRPYYGSNTALSTVTSQKAQGRTVESEDNIKGSCDVINEEKGEFVDDMMVLRFGFVGSLVTASNRLHIISA